MRRGFTLIELLVVIAIISILAAILFPVFAQAREKARQIVCMSNIRQLAMAFQIYASDHSDRLPGPWWWWAGYTPDSYAATNYYTWADAIMPYIRNDQIFQCPTRTYTQAQMAYGTFPFSYYYNMTWHTQGSLDGYLPYSSLGRIPRPADTIILADGWGSMDAYWPYDVMSQLYSGSYVSGYPDIRATVRRHNNGANFAFADGHAKWQANAVPQQWTTIRLN